MWRDSNKTAARPRGHASIVDDGGESAVFHMTQSRDSAVGQAPWLETNIPLAIREACSSPASQRHVRPPAQREAD